MPFGTVTEKLPLDDVVIRNVSPSARRKKTVPPSGKTSIATSSRVPVTAPYCGVGDGDGDEDGDGDGDGDGEGRGKGDEQPARPMIAALSSSGR